MSFTTRMNKYTAIKPAKTIILFSLKPLYFILNNKITVIPEQAGIYKALDKFLPVWTLEALCFEHKKTPRLLTKPIT